MSDVFGSLVKQKAADQTADKTDGLIGAGLLMPSVNGVALRSMKDPGTAYNDPQIGRDPQPGNMANYVDTTDDSGDVHINSGIPNHAFFLTAARIGGYAWEKAGRIWYVTLTTRLQADADFQAAAAVSSKLCRVVGTGWELRLIVLFFCEKISPSGSGKDSSVTKTQFFRWIDRTRHLRGSFIFLRLEAL